MMDLSQLEIAGVAECPLAEAGVALYDPSSDGRVTGRAILPIRGATHRLILSLHQFGAIWCQNSMLLHCTVLCMYKKCHFKL